MLPDVYGDHNSLRILLGQGLLLYQKESDFVFELTLNVMHFALLRDFSACPEESKGVLRETEFI
jgi:hypothetical protein